MFSPTTSNPVRTAAWRRAVLDAVDLAVAFATLDSYAMPGSTRAERSMPAGAGMDRSARSVTSGRAGSDPRSEADRRLPQRTASPQRPYGAVDLAHGPGHGRPVRPAAAQRRSRRPGATRVAHHCTSPLDAFARAGRHVDERS